MLATLRNKEGCASFENRSHVTINPFGPDFGKAWSYRAGNPFMSRQSYLAHEIRWGFQFVRCIHRPHGKDTRYTVDTGK